MSPTTWFRLLGLSCLLVAAAFAVPALTDDTKKGKKYALLVGVTQYDSAAFRHLRYAENDVEKLAEILNGKGGFDSVRVLSPRAGKKDGNDAPTAANIKAALEAVLEKKTRHDTVLIAFSGHGATVKVEDPEEKGDPKTYPFFCPSDADLVKISYSTGRSKTLVNLDDVFDQLKACGAGAKLVLIDACRNELKAKSATRKLDVGAVSVPKGVAALFSCSEDEVAWESEKVEHGVFFHFVLEGLRGKARNDKGEVTWARLSEYVTAEVPAQVGEIAGGGAKQTPHEVRNVRGASPVLARIETKDDLAAKDREGSAQVVKGLLDGESKNSLGMEFVLVKKGKFTMGSPKDEKDRSDYEQAHEVEITRDFYLGVHEVTQAQFREVMGFNPSYYSLDGKKAEGGRYGFEPGGGKEKVKGFTQKELDTFPVENVSWAEAQAFLKQLNALAAEKEKGRVYRLPSEAEWEYACRGGPSSSSKPFHFKKPSDSLSSGQANFNGNWPYGGADKARYLGRTEKVGSYEPNKLGLYDMHGNVWEWCQDYYDKDYYANSPVRDPLCLKGQDRVNRGGGWFGAGQHSRSAQRFGNTPEDRYNDVGIRLALAPGR